jgi:hypothetical protein
MPFKEILQFRECPEEPLKWTSWLSDCQQISQNTTMQLVNGEGKKILCSYYSIFSLGMHFTQKEEIWNPTAADVSRLTYDVFVRKCPTLPEND